MTAPVYLRLCDLSDRAREDVRRLAREWLGDEPWSVCDDTTIPGWWDADDPDDQPAIPLHLGAGADLGVRILAEWEWAGHRAGFAIYVASTLLHELRQDPAQLLAALLAAAPKA